MHRKYVDSNPKSLAQLSPWITECWTASYRGPESVTLAHTDTDYTYTINGQHMWHIVFQVSYKLLASQSFNASYYQWYPILVNETLKSFLWTGIIQLLKITNTANLYCMGTGDLHFHTTRLLAEP